MPRSATGSVDSPRRRRLGFTLLEILIVLALVAVAIGAVSLALPDPVQVRLEREAERLALLLETARAQARAAALPVSWRPALEGSGADFGFVGLPASRKMPERWLDPGVLALLPGGRTAITLGPEPVLEPQRIELVLGPHRLAVASDGLAPFAVAPSELATR